jgi:hypothetical protein
MSTNHATTKQPGHDVYSTGDISFLDHMVAPRFLAEYLAAKTAMRNVAKRDDLPFLAISREIPAERAGCCEECKQARRM